VLLDEAIGADAFLLVFIPDLAFRAALDAFAVLLDEAIRARFPDAADVSAGLIGNLQYS
jgi:hypothetical protein